MSKREGKAPKGPTDPLSEQRLSLPPADAVVAFNVVGTDLDIPLPAGRQNFTIGSDLKPEVDVSISSRLLAQLRGVPNPEAWPEAVSKLHVMVQRKGNRLWVVDQTSTNGTFFKDRR